MYTIFIEIKENDSNQEAIASALTSLAETLDHDLDQTWKITGSDSNGNIFEAERTQEEIIAMKTEEDEEA